MFFDQCTCPTISHFLTSNESKLMTNVRTRLGELSGLEKADVIEYRGVPFAEAPTGAWRLRAPRPLRPWTGVKACETHAPSAWQENNALMGIADPELDCLYLNLWVPKGKGPFPVMVWLHGGGYVTGSPSQLLYQGERLAVSQQVVVVNVTYRLGALGFGNFKPWLPETDSNLGMRDQLAALDWVQAHIADFGGDPGQVTVFGESAGGFSVACLLACEQAQPLFRRAIIQSGAGDMVVTPEEAERISAAFVEALGGPQQLLVAGRADWVKAQRVSYRMTVERGLRQSTPQYGMTWLPQVDGDLLHGLPVDAIAQGSARDKALLASVCRDEWNLFQYALPFNGNTPMEKLLGISKDEVLRRFKRALPLGNDAEQAFAHYAQTPPHARRSKLDWLAALETDRLFILPTQRLLDAQIGAGGQAHAGVFTHETEMFGVPLGACHVSDVPFVFDLVDKPIGKLFTGGGDDARMLAHDVQRIWGDFARGKPLDWQGWQTGEQGRARAFGPGSILQPLLSPERLALWETWVPTAEKQAESA